MPSHFSNGAFRILEKGTLLVWRLMSRAFRMLEIEAVVDVDQVVSENDLPRHAGTARNAPKRRPTCMVPTLTNCMEVSESCSLGEQGNVAELMKRCLSLNLPIKEVSFHLREHRFGAATFGSRKVDGLDSAPLSVSKRLT